MFKVVGIISIIISTLIIGFSSFAKIQIKVDPNVKQPSKPESKVESKMKAQKADEQKIVTTESGLKFLDEAVGTGLSPKTGQTVKVHYTGWLQNGTKFDSSVDRGTPFEFPIGVGQVIKGWDEGVITMKIGGKRKLIIPPQLGYGSRGAGSIPPDSTLIFDVELLGLQ